MEIVPPIPAAKVGKNDGFCSEKGDLKRQES